MYYRKEIVSNGRLGTPEEVVIDFDENGFWYTTQS